MKNIVVGFNATEPCKTAVRAAAAIAGTCGAHLHVVSVEQPIVPVGGFGWAAPYDSTGYIADLVADRCRTGTEIAGQGCEVTAHAEMGSPSNEIVRIARENEAGMIVLGASHHSAIERIFLGSTADRVIRLAHVPCLIAATPDAPKRILVAADDSEFGRHALQAALRIATLCGAESIHCLHVTTEPPPPAAMVGTFDVDYYTDALAGSFDKFVQDVRSGEGESAPEVATKVRVGGIDVQIVAEIEASGVDLLVIGTHGRGFVGRKILGSTSEAVLRQSPISTLVVPGEE
ncbi:MAG: universal stress protein [Planctomycetota bacterium]|jgi:nucleotide-binding universal stress UspA family protein